MFFLETTSCAGKYNFYPCVFFPELCCEVSAIETSWDFTNQQLEYEWYGMVWPWKTTPSDPSDIEYWIIFWNSSRRSHHHESSKTCSGFTSHQVIPNTRTAKISENSWLQKNCAKKRMWFSNTSSSCLATTWNNDEHSQAWMQNKKQSNTQNKSKAWL